jgi:hypothetical protein
MNSSRPDAERSFPCGSPDTQRQLADWIALFDQCAHKPSQKIVHRLRRATLRLQAEVEFGRRMLSPEDPAVHAVKLWSKQAKKLHRALGALREADVSLRKLNSLRKSVARSSPPSTLRQINRLERRIRRHRTEAAKRLPLQMKKLGRKLFPPGRELCGMLDLPKTWDGGSGEETVSNLVSGLAQEFVEIDRPHLHSFRKRSRELCVLAGICATTDPQARHAAAILKKMQTAAGQWHDWQTLAKEAERTFRRRYKTGDLLSILQALEGRSLQVALHFCRRSSAEWRSILDGNTFCNL